MKTIHKTYGEEEGYLSLEAENDQDQQIIDALRPFARYWSSQSVGPGHSRMTLWNRDNNEVFHMREDFNVVQARIVKLEAELAEARELIAVQRFALDESARALADNAVNGAVLKRALKMACKDMHWTVAMPLPLWRLGRPATVEEVYAYYIALAKEELQP